MDTLESYPGWNFNFPVFIILLTLLGLIVIWSCE